jgi:hypothetical protein
MKAISLLSYQHQLTLTIGATFTHWLQLGTPSIFQAMSSPIGDTLRNHTWEIRNIKERLKEGMAKVKEVFGEG